ncbi:protein-lysine N-methyltransferase EEF2KMT [Sergentomyia squamirostris]
MDLDKLAVVQAQFLCGYPVKKINLESLFQNISWESQQIFLKETIGHSLIISKPISYAYLVAFLREAIQVLEQKTQEVHDDFYTEFLRVQQLASVDQTQVYKHYRVALNNAIVSVRETTRLITDGTTGLRTWPASLALCEWFTHNLSKFSGKTVIELGAGIGMAGIVLAQIANNCKILLTDFHERVLNFLIENIKENSLGSNNNSLQAIPFDWTSEEDLEKIRRDHTPDIVYAADVVYDSEIFPALCRVLKNFIKMNNCDVILSCTVRNEITFQDFISKLDDEDLSISLEKFYEANNFYWDNSCEIKIFSVRLKN